MAITWRTARIGAELRFDCCENLGGTIRIAASRYPTPGLVFRADNVNDWKHVATIGTKQITAIANAGSGLVFLVDEDSRVYKSVDYGDNWTDLGQVSNSTVAAIRSYGLYYTAAGTLLLSDTRTAGGKIWRSTNNGASWTDIGAVGTDGLYVITADGSTIIVTDFSGRVHKSTDDGLTWTTCTTTATGSGITEAAWGLGVISSGVWCVAHESGKIYRTTNSGTSWTLVHTMSGAADYLGAADSSRVICSTYTNGNVLYESEDGGVTWSSVSAIPTVTGDYISRGVRVGNDLFCTTEKGYAVYSEDIPPITPPGRLWDLDRLSSAIWTDASDSTTLFDATSGGSAVAADGAVARIEDQSGNSRHLTQSTSGKRPVRKTSIWNDMDVLRFDGSDDALGISSTNAAANVGGLSIFVVGRTSAVSTTSYLPFIRFRTATDVDRAGLYPRQSSVEAGGRRLDANSYQFVQRGTLVNSQMSVACAIFDFANATLAAGVHGAITNRSGGFQTAGSTSNTSGRLDVGGHSVNSGATINGDIGEIFVVAGAVDTDTRQKIEGRLHHKWGLEYLLPFDHPYKYSPPAVFAPTPPPAVLCPRCLGTGLI